MTRYQQIFWTGIVVMSLLWLATASFPTTLTYFGFRDLFVQYSGVISMSAMAIAVILAARPRWLEMPLKGLDKMYRLHKWLGILALVSSIAHWWIALGTKWMVGWGWIMKPQRGPRSGEEIVLPPIQEFLNQNRHLAETLGEWSFYIATALIVLALVKAVPYLWFRRTHQWISVLYLVLLFHSVVLVKYEYWATPLGVCLAVMFVMSGYYALKLLALRVGISKVMHSVVNSVCNSHSYIDLQVAMPAGWKGHRPGQFAFISLNKAEGAHPFTIASGGNSNQQLRFLIKPLGDWTQQLKNATATHAHVEIDGPYGDFIFEDKQPAQLWFAAGIGVTPFLARMDELSQQGGSDKSIRFIFTYKDDDKALAELVEQKAKSAGVDLQLHNSSQRGRLNLSAEINAINDIERYSVWFCGPVQLGDSIRQLMRERGCQQHFHQELFEMR